MECICLFANSPLLIDLFGCRFAHFFLSRLARNPLSVGHPIVVECFGLLLALVGRNKEDGIRERRQTGAITPPDIPEIGVKPNKLKCAHSSSSSFHQQTRDDGDRIPFLYLNDANASQSGEKSPQRSPRRIGQLPGKTKTFH